MGPAGRKIGKAAFLIVKLAVSGLLLAVLLSRVGGKVLLDNMLAVNPFAFAAAIALYLLMILISAHRWRQLIPYCMPVRRLFSLYAIGAFFNTCLPGIIGGDAVKAYYLNRELKAAQSSSPGSDLPGSVSTSIASVFMDRYVGFVALLSIGLAALPFGLHLFPSSPVAWALPAAAAAFLCGSLLLPRIPATGFFRKLSGVAAYMRLYRRQTSVLKRALGLSLLLQVLNAFSVYILAIGLGFDLSFLALLIVLPLIIVISLLPVSISGLGIREGAFVYFLGLLGIAADKAMTLSMLWFLSVVAASLWGLAEYLRFKVPLGGGEEEKTLQV